MHSWVEYTMTFYMKPYIFTTEHDTSTYIVNELTFIFIFFLIKIGAEMYAKYLSRKAQRNDSMKSKYEHITLKWNLT